RPRSSIGPKTRAASVFAARRSARPSGRNQTDDSRHRASRRDCFVAPLLAMTAIWGVIASAAKQSRESASTIASAVPRRRRSLGLDLLQEPRGLAAVQPGDVVLVFEQDTQGVVDRMRRQL